MTRKRRLSASIDAVVLDAAEMAVESGRAASISAWVNGACQRQIDHDRRLAAMDDFLAQFEAEFGEITETDIADATRRTRAAAIVVRAAPLPPAVQLRAAKVPAGGSSRTGGAATDPAKRATTSVKDSHAKRRSS